jgi:N-acetylmuramoyl-L-alanine amidase
VKFAAFVAVGAAVALALSAAPSASSAPPPGKPLAGVVIALDPGHQLGNANPQFRTQLSRTHFNGYITKGCNTTGTATNGGYPEATLNWVVAKKVKKRLRSLGATVKMTRNSNSWNAWGPCVDTRGRFGAKVGADLLVSIHADGASSTGSGFYIMVPASIPGWTDRTAGPSLQMGQRFVQGMAGAGAPRSTYITGQILVTREISTLNFSRVPAILVEMGNMRNASDAARMTSPAGRKRYADWFLAGIRAALQR